jgi:hypothetical protein
MSENDDYDQRRASLKAIVRSAMVAALGDRDAEALGELDRAVLDLAVDALTFVHLADAWMKVCGPLSVEQQAGYQEACRVRDGTLRALKVSDPYRNHRRLAS